MAYLLLAAFIFLADFFVKSQIEARKPSDFPVELSHGLKLERHHNRGFFLNRLEEKPRLVRALAACAAVPPGRGRRRDAACPRSRRRRSWRGCCGR